MKLMNLYLTATSKLRQLLTSGPLPSFTPLLKEIGAEFANPPFCSVFFLDQGGQSTSRLYCIYKKIKKNFSLSSSTTLYFLFTRLYKLNTSSNQNISTTMATSNCHIYNRDLSFFSFCNRNALSCLTFSLQSSAYQILPTIGILLP